MTLSALQSAVASMRCHPLTDLPIYGITFDGARVRVDGEWSLTAAELRKDLADAEQQADAAEKEREAAEEEAKRLDCLTDETLADAVRERDEYRAEALAWRAHATKLEAELTALRQRKGAAPGVARESGRILLLLRRLASADGEARAILESIEP